MMIAADTTPRLTVTVTQPGAGLPAAPMVTTVPRPPADRRPAWALAVPRPRGTTVIITVVL